MSARLVLTLCLVLPAAALAQGFPPPPVPVYPGAEPGRTKYLDYQAAKVNDRDPVTGAASRTALGSWWKLEYKTEAGKDAVAGFFRDWARDHGARIQKDRYGDLDFHFPGEQGEVWVELDTRSSAYTIAILAERPHRQTLVFGDPKPYRYRKAGIGPVPPHPVVTPFADSHVTRAQHQARGELRLSYKRGGERVRETVTGAYWKLGFELLDSDGRRDRQFTRWKIVANFRGAIQLAGGRILRDMTHSTAKLQFQVPGPGSATTWGKLDAFDGGYRLELVSGR